jgi:hypothetical protein
MLNILFQREFNTDIKISEVLRFLNERNHHSEIWDILSPYDSIFEQIEAIDLDDILQVYPLKDILLAHDEKEIAEALNGIALDNTLFNLNELVEHLDT